MTVDLDALASLAAEATPGPWEDVPTHIRAIRMVMGPPDRDGVRPAIVEGGFAEPLANPAFIAAADPSTVAALVEVAKAAQAVAQTHHYGTRFTSNGREAVPKEKLERLREKLAPFGRAGDETA